MHIHSVVFARSPLISKQKVCGNT